MLQPKRIRTSMMPKCQYAMYPKKFIIELLEIYRNSPCLWKTKSEEYFDRVKKDRAYDIIIDKLQEVESFPDRKMAISLFGALRFYYRKQLKLVEQGRKPTLWYFKHMDFIRDHLYANRRLSSFDAILNNPMHTESSEDNENSADLSSSSFSSQYHYTSFTDSSLNDVTSPTFCMETESSADLTRSPDNNTYTEQECSTNQVAIITEVEEEPSAQYFKELGKAWADILKNIPIQQQIIAEKLINDILYEGHMEKLTDQCPLEILNTLRNT